MGQRSEANRAYYGREMGSRQIVIDMQASNPGADPLRDVLTRYGTPEQKQAAVPAPAAYQPPPVAGAPTDLQPRSPVQQQSLPPPK